MAITVTTSPADYALAKTPVPIVLTTDNLFSSSGSKAVFIIICDSLGSGLFPTDGESFSFTFGTTELIFEFKDSPNTNGLQLTSGIGASSPSDYGFTYLLPELMSNYTLLENFDFSYAWDGSNFVITLTAKEEKAWGTVDLTGTVTSLTFEPPTDGTDATRRENFEILLDVFAEPTLNASETAGYPILDLIAQFSGTPNNDGEATFDLSEVLSSIVTTHFPEPTVTIDGTNYISIIDGNLRLYHLRFCERYGSTPATQKFIPWPSEDLSHLNLYFSRTLNAGKNNVQRAGFNDDFTGDFCPSTLRRFLTNRPNSFSATKDQPLYLDILSQNNDSFKLVFGFTYTDGSTSTYSAPTITKADTNETVIRCVAGYNQLSLDSQITVGKTVKSYTIKLYNAAGSTQISETITVTLIANKKNERFFLFENSLGGVDTLYTYGNFETNLDFKNLIVENYNQEPENGIYNGEFGEVNNKTQELMELHTGYLTKEYQAYLKDFLYAKKRYLVEGSNLLKVNLPSQSVVLFTDRSQVFALKLKVEKAWTEKSL